MTGITGLGGIFVRSGDKPGAMTWYREKLGLDIQDWGGINFNWRNENNPDQTGYSLFSLFDRNTEYFGDKGQETMVNFRVEDLDSFLATLRASGVTVIDKIEDGDYGRFGWIEDPEGTRIELWEPPEGQRG